MTAATETTGPGVAARAHVVATEISAQPAVPLERGFRLLVMRQFLSAEGPPAFAVIEQGLVRAPLRPARHGLAFAIAFRPEVVAWLSGELGRPSQRDAAGLPCRNPAWPQTCWRQDARAWPDEIRTIDWSVDAVFPQEAAWRAFEARWRGRLLGVEHPLDMAPA